MRIPAKRIRFTRTWDGRSEGEGYLVIDIKGLDIEGATSLVMSIEELEEARRQTDKGVEARDKLRDLLGG